MRICNTECYGPLGSSLHGRAAWEEVHSCVCIYIYIYMCVCMYSGVCVRVRGGGGVVVVVVKFSR